MIFKQFCIFTKTKCLVRRGRKFQHCAIVCFVLVQFFNQSIHCSMGWRFVSIVELCGKPTIRVWVYFNFSYVVTKEHWTYQKWRTAYACIDVRNTYKKRKRRESFIFNKREKKLSDKKKSVFIFLSGALLIWLYMLTLAKVEKYKMFYTSTK